MGLILGIDPGISGGVAIIHSSGYLRNHTPSIQKFTTENDIIDFIRFYKPDFAYLEQVHSMPGQGVSSTFTFGCNYGFYRGVLLALQIPFETVTPNKWQKYLYCQTKGDKNVSKAKAQELYPSIKITHAIADALLIATYGARISKNSDSFNFLD